MTDGLQISSLSKAFDGTVVLQDIDLDVRPGEFVSLVGASGCGKSTLLRVIAGLEQQDAGRVRIGERDVSHERPRDRNVAMVFQSYALYPHMTVAGNIATPLVMAELGLAERLPLLGRLSPRRGAVMRRIMAEVGQIAGQLQIEQLLQRKPAQLSGGQRQRVALARAMVRRPAVFLMDEPLSNLDAKLRVHMRAELTSLHRRLGATFVYVTHDQVEAMTMSDRVALMAGGRILQLGTPSELYDAPRNLAVAQFIGSPAINTLAIEHGARDTLACLGWPLPVAAGTGARPVTLAIRPEALRLRPRTLPAGSGQAAAGMAGPEFAWPARVSRIEHHGPERIVELMVETTEAPTLLARVAAADSGRLDLNPSLPVTVVFAVADAFLFDAAGERVALADHYRRAEVA